MTTSRFGNYGILIAVLLVAVIVTGAIIIWARFNPGQPVDITTPPTPELQGQIYIEGAVSNPGLYPLISGDTLEDLIQAAGGITDNASPDDVTLYIPEAEEGEPTQKIDINRAEAWLLDALPGIGETRAQAIVDYREQNGPFHSINEIVNVEGIGSVTYEEIKDLITVSD
jgi:competence protein ComEA